MVLKIDWGEPSIQEKDVLQIKPSDLDDFYVKATDLDKANIYFVLLNSYYICMDADNQEAAAHLSFLIAYYLFISFTPPASCELALRYIKQAITLHPTEEYLEWLALIREGN